MKIRNLNLVCTELDPKRFPRSGLSEIAISGRSNVGKSSLLNMILGRKNIARVSREPGKTRTVNYFLINDQFYLVDLPGYGYAKVSREMRTGWQKIIYEYIEEREQLAGVIQLIDSRHTPTKDDLLMLQRLIDGERETLAVFTKSDKIGRNERGKALAYFRSCFDGISVGPAGEEDRDGNPYDIQTLFSSAKNGEGKNRIWSWIASRI